jgi:signal transduction histidine kinase/DNA-binding response OmpR family regulator
MAQILVIEDDPHVGRALVDLLRHHGYQADRAESGEQGLERLGAEPFGLVLLDVRLPGLNGFDTCRRLRETHGPSLPVIMLTAFGDATALRQAHDAGADDFLHKPVDTPALILKVRAFLRLKSLHEETVKNREEARGRARDLALLHEISRDWSLLAEPEEAHRMMAKRLAELIGAPICGMAFYDPATRRLTAALPVHGLPEEVARQLDYVVTPEYRSLWSFKAGRPYVSNHARSDPRLVQELIQLAEVDSVLLVPLVSEGKVRGLFAAANKPGGFTDGDVQLLSVFAGVAANLLRSRDIFNRERRHAARLERLAALVGEMAAASGRARLVELTASRIQKDLGCARVAFYRPEDKDGVRLECEAGSARPSDLPPEEELLRFAVRSATALPAAPHGLAAELAVPVRAGEHVFGVLDVLRTPAEPFTDDEVNLLSTLSGQLALALQRAESEAVTERMARQMATLYDLGLETSALRDLRFLFVKAAQEAGRLIQADQTSVFRLDEREAVLRLFVGWTRDRATRRVAESSFRVGEGIAGRVARDLVPAFVNDAEGNPELVPRGFPISRILCVPLTFYDPEREAPALFGVLNASRGPGEPPFTNDDLEYLTRFAGQLSIAVANAMAFEAERQRSQQLALVNALVREISGNLARDRILETAVRRIHEAFRYPVVSITVPAAETGLFRVAALASRDPWPEGGASYPLDVGVTGKALREKRTVLASDVSKDPDYVVNIDSTRSEVAIPIFSGDEVVAILDVESEVPDAFDRGQVITLETLADSIGIILRNAELYQTLEETNSKLLELDRMKSELVNIVAHDFRAPLSGILGYAELLEWKPDAPLQPRVERAQAIIKSATHMANLVDKTLKTTRLETGQFPFEFGLVDLVAKSREVMSRFPSDPRHPVALEAPDYPLPAWADGDRVAEVVENLLSNAVKYSPSGGDIRLVLTRKGETAIVSVVDRGIGIAAENQAQLFRPYSRVRDGSTAGIEGSGLGLYICERIVRAHGGTLTVTSEPGQGSTFAFTLPLFGAAAQVRAPLVLVAARDAGTRREVRRVAEELGFGIHEVTDGVDALEAAIRLVPSAVVMDRILPRLGAEQVAQRLREHAGTGAVPLVALAEEADLGAQASLFRACVPKPLDREALTSALMDLQDVRA